MNANRCIPPVTIIPEVSYPDVVQATAWLEKAFGLQVRIRIGDHRVQMMLGDAALVVKERGADANPSSILLRVDDADACCARVAELGAKVMRTPETFPFGERQGRIEDFAGNRWTLSQTVAEADPSEFGFETGPAFPSK